MKWNMGCSGFYYKEWKNLFYPPGLPQKKWFEFYCSKFNTLEMNVTFYQFPRKETLRKWYDASDANFKFSVKAPRLITHFKKLKDAVRLLDDFYTAVEGLQEKIGAVLFQLPPSFVYNEENLKLVTDNINRPGFTNVTEFRHTSWWNTEVYNELEKSNITFCGISHPKLPDDAVVNNKITYYRFHGVPNLYYSGYEHSYLKKIADTITQAKKCKEAFVYFNNTATIEAIENCTWLKEYCDESPMQ